MSHAIFAKQSEHQPISLNWNASCIMTFNVWSFFQSSISCKSFSVHVDPKNWILQTRALSGDRRQWWPMLALHSWLSYGMASLSCLMLLMFFSCKSHAHTAEIGARLQFSRQLWMHMFAIDMPLLFTSHNSSQYWWLFININTSSSWWSCCTHALWNTQPYTVWHVGYGRHRHVMCLQLEERRQASWQSFLCTGVIGHKLFQHRT